jgi:molybdenum cofactor biosynthesis enzyme MoaA
MSREIAELSMAALQSTDIPVVDITGGAPELNPNFRWLVERSKRLGRHVMDRLQPDGAVATVAVGPGGFNSVC